MKDMNDEWDASSMTSMHSLVMGLKIAETSFHSIVSDDEKNIQETGPSFEESVDEVKEFCLDIAKLEVVASKIYGLPCQIRRTTNFGQSTYFLLRADFNDGSSWNVIVPHPDQLQIQDRHQGIWRRSLEYRIQDGKNQKPRLISCKTLPNNEAGVAYLFVEMVSGRACLLLGLL